MRYVVDCYHPFDGGHFSYDGIHFRRTGVSISGGMFTTIFVDPHDAPERRYKVFWIEGFGPEPKETDGIYAGYSADGVHFTKSGRVMPLMSTVTWVAISSRLSYST